MTGILLSCCLKGFEETRSFSPDTAHLMLGAMALAALGVVVSSVTAVWLRLRA